MNTDSDKVNEREIEKRTPIQAGDIFYESWGYDQTNIDFAQVVRISLTGKTVICRMMGKERATPESVKPTEAWGIEFRLKVDPWFDRESGVFRGTYLRGSYPFVQSNNSTPNPSYRFGIFNRYTEPVYETPFGMGH